MWRAYCAPVMFDIWTSDLPPFRSIYTRLCQLCKPTTSVIPLGAHAALRSLIIKSAHCLYIIPTCLYGCNVSSESEA
jgi:hypothetical protein